MLSLALALSTQADAALVINEILADPGSVNDANCDGTFSSTQDEFVEIINTGPTGVDLSGYTLNDFVGIKHTFPAGSTIAVGAVALVYAGGVASCQLPANVSVHMASSGSLGLNHTSPWDTVSLLNTTGVVVATYTFGAEAGFDESITLSPDGNTGAAMVGHSTVANTTMSPGTKIDGSAFGGGGPVVATLSQPNPGTAGVANVWTLTGGAANTTYMLIGSITPGQFVHPFCPNDPASMSNPQVIGQAVTNGNGGASFQAVVPAVVAGRTAYVQAAAASVCDITNLVTTQF